MRSIALVDRLHAPVLVEALEAAGLHPHAEGIASFRQLDYFGAQRADRVELFVDEAETEAALATLAMLESEASEAASREAQSTVAGSSPRSANPVRRRRWPWLIAAACTVTAVGAPVFLRSRRLSDALHPRIAARVRAPSAAEQVEPDLHAAGVR